MSRARRWRVIALGILLVVGGLGLRRKAPARRAPLCAWTAQIVDAVVVVKAEGVLACAKESPVSAPQEVGGGRIETVLDEGTRVAKGDVIAQLSTESFRSEEREARLELTKKQAELARQASDDGVARSDLEIKVATQRADLTLNQELLAVARAGADERTLAALELRIEKAKVENAGLRRRLDDQEALRGRGFLSELDYASVANELEKARLDQQKQENLLALQREGARPQELGRIEALVGKFSLGLEIAQATADSQGRQQSLNRERKQTEIEDKRTTVQERLRLRGLTTLRAPAAGTVLYSESFWGADELGPGVQVYPGQALVKVVGRGEMDAKVHIAERWVERVKVGQKARVKVSGDARWLTGRVQAVSNAAEQLTNDPKAPRMVPVVIRLDQDPLELRPNTHCTARIEVASEAQVVAVPADLVRERKAGHVTVEVWNGVSTPRTFPVVDEDADHVFVRGLSEGDTLTFEGDEG